MNVIRFLGVFLTIFCAIMSAEVLAKLAIVGWMMFLENRKRVSMPALQRPAPQHPEGYSGLHPFGFFRCERCSCEYVFTSMTEFEDLIDTHVCRSVPA